MIIVAGVTLGWLILYCMFDLVENVQVHALHRHIYILQNRLQHFDMLCAPDCCRFESKQGREEAMTG
jgi:hypothetical protein